MLPDGSCVRRSRRSVQHWRRSGGRKRRVVHPYAEFSERDEQIWAESTKAFVEEGNRVSHDADAIGGTIAVSCDMCHPNAANTHPETYPKMKALEAFIYAQRKGVPLEFGKH